MSFHTNKTWLINDFFSFSSFDATLPNLDVLLKIAFRVGKKGLKHIFL